jgi:hypothetical protein
MFNRVSKKAGQGGRETAHVLGLGGMERVFKETVVLGSGGHIYSAAAALSLAQL